MGSSDDEMKPLGEALLAWRKERAAREGRPYVETKLPTPAQIRQRLADEDAEHWRQEQLSVPQRLLKLGCPVECVARIRPGGGLNGWEALLIAEDFERSKKPVLLLCGGNQVGKTTAACWLMSRRFREDRISWPGDLDENNQPMWHTRKNWESRQVFTGPDALAAARAQPWSPEHSAWQRLLDTKFLVIDELGRELAPVGAALTKLLQHRLTVRLPTVLTSNLTLAQFRPEYGDRLAERMNQVGVVYECGARVAA